MAVNNCQLKSSNVNVNNNININDNNNAAKYADICSYYHIHDKKLGEGGFAKVRLGTHLATGQHVAIKCLDKIKLGAELPRIYNEIECLKRLKHRNIAKLYQVFETSTVIYLVLEYCAGGELFDYIVSKSKLEEAESAQIIFDLMRVLDFIHVNGFAHRDLKPENVLFDEKHQIKLIDFGLAANCSADNMATNRNQPPLDQLSTCCGSITYAAPEVISGGVYSGTACDVWSVGVMLYALLVGQLPFNDNSIPKLYQKIQGGIKTLPSFLSSDSRDLIKKMLIVDPKQRITVRQVLTHPWLRKRRSAATTATQMIFTPSSPTTTPTKRKITTTTVATPVPPTPIPPTTPTTMAAVATTTTTTNTPAPLAVMTRATSQKENHRRMAAAFAANGEPATPRKSIVKRLLESATPAKLKRPRKIVTNHPNEVMNITLTKYRDPNLCLEHFQQALKRKGLQCKQKDFSLKCFNKSIRLTLEVCTYNNQCAIQRKRIKGDAWQYKLVCEEILRISNATSGDSC